MNERRAVTAFYVETLMMILVFIGIMMVLTRIFVLSKTQENEARNLTRAVTIAGNVAEGLSLSDDVETNMKKTGLEGSLVENTEKKKIYEGKWTWPGKNPGQKGQNYKVRITLTRDRKMVHHLIQIYCGDEKKPVYTIETDRAIIGADRRGAAG